jgi:hypothetical protein
MFADARGAGVLGLPTSAIFESMYQETNSNADLGHILPYRKAIFSVKKL